MSIRTPELEMAAYKVLADAVSVRDSLLSVLEIGHPSVKDTAHFITSRVKSFDSLINKVIERRLRRDVNPEKYADYNINDVTDIVGLRLLALFRDDLATLTEAFLNTLLSLSDTSLSILEKNTLQESVREVIIYPPAFDDDGETDVIRAVFNKFGLTVTQENKATMYSSIHIVLFCKKDGRGSAIIPVEVQIRTVLENYWSDVNHKLSYKRNNDGNSPDRIALLENYDHQLKDTKMHLDTFTRTLSRAKKQIYKTLSTERIALSPSTSNTKNLKALSELFKGTAKALFQQAIEQLMAAYNKLEESSNDTSTYPSIVEMLCQGREYLQKTLIEYKDFSVNHDEETRNYIQYYIRMEIALCYLREGDYLTRQSRTAASKEKAELAEKAEIRLNAADTEYRNIQTELNKSRDPIIEYRRSEIYMINGKPDESCACLERASDYLKDSDLPAQHEMRVYILRSLGVTIWEQAMHGYRGSENSPPDSPSRRRVIFSISQAYEETKKAFDIDIQPSTDEWSKVDPDQEKNRTINNLLSYGTSLLELGSNKDYLKSLGFTEDFVRMQVNRLEQSESPAWADTVRACYAFLGDKEKEHAAAEKVLNLLELPQSLAKYSEEARIEMAKKANQSLH